MRLFFGCFLPPPIIADLTKLYQELGTIKAKLVEPHNLHLNLVFIGEVKESDLAKVIKIGELAASQNHILKIKLAGYDLIPNKQKPRVLAIKTKADQEFNLLQKCLSQNLAILGYITNIKPAHLTLARLKSAIINPLPDFNPFFANISKFSLIKSQLTFSGPIYTPLQSFKLAS